MIEAWDKIGGRSRDVSAQQFDKWLREIATLDADNKAKLKVKYEFRTQMADANKLREKPAKTAPRSRRRSCCPDSAASRFSQAVSPWRFPT